MFAIYLEKKPQLNFRIANQYLFYTQTPNYHYRSDFVSFFIVIHSSQLTLKRIWFFVVLECIKK